MNNNRGNNRRRGRGNNSRPQGGGSSGGGGGQQLNRIDSRARGNAPQMLEKYRKLASDAHLNGDRVQAEYFLQFADHYFRVIADTRQRQEEQRAQRDSRWQDGDGPEREGGNDDSEYAEGDFPAFDQQPAYVSRREREAMAERPERQERSDRPAQDQSERPERPNSTRQHSERQIPERQPREGSKERFERPERDYRRDEPVEQDDSDSSGEAAAAVAVPAFEPAENPFVRPTRGLRPRRDDRRPAREPAGEREPGDEPAGLDPSMLPPAISIPRDDSEEIAAKPRRTRRPRAAEDNAMTSAGQD